MWKGKNYQFLRWVCVEINCCSSSAHCCPCVCPCLWELCALDAQPTEGEREVWNQVNSVLQDSESILSGLQAYKGAGQEIRDVRNCCSSVASRPQMKVTKAGWGGWCCVYVSLFFSPGNSKPQRFHSAGASLELSLPPGHQTQEVLQFLPQTRYDQEYLTSSYYLYYFNLSNHFKQREK